jgi:hypothetical protein
VRDLCFQKQRRNKNLAVKPGFLPVLGLATAWFLGMSLQLPEIKPGKSTLNGHLDPKIIELNETLSS